MPRQSDEVTVRAPGSIANLGPGFDVFALSSPYDLLTVETTAERGVRLRVAGQGSESSPSNLNLTPPAGWPGCSYGSST